MPFDMPFDIAGYPFGGILFAMFGLRWLLYATPFDDDDVDVGDEEDDDGCEVCDCDGDGGVW